MKTDKRKEIIVGIVTLAAFAILVIALLFGENIISRKNNFIAKIEFSDVGGLQSGDPIMMRGVTIGKVKSVQLIGNRVIVEAYLQDISLLKSDVTAKISMLTIMGGKKIDIMPGNSEERFNIKKTIQGAESVDFATVLSDISSMKNDIICSVKRVDSIAISVNGLMSDPQFIKNLKGTVNNADKVVGKLNVIINLKTAQELITDLKETSKALKDITSGKSKEITSIIENLDKTSSFLADFAMNNPNLSVDIKKIANNLNLITQKLSENDNTLGKLINDKEFSKELAGTLEELQKLIKNISENGVNANIRLGARP